MKKLLLVLLSALFISGCNSNKITTQKEIHKELPKYTIDDLYPFEENVRLKYEGKGNEFASQDVYVDYIRGNIIQLRVINAGTTSAKVLQKANGELSMLYTRGEFYYREDLTTKEPEKSEVLLKEPILKGTSWTLSNGDNRSITEIDVDLNTPYGSLKAVEVTTTSKDSTVKTYYCKGIGMIKQLFTSNGMEVSTTLEKVEKNTAVLQTVKFYYPDVINDKVVYVKKQLALKTNEEIKPLIEKNMKESIGKSIGKTLPTATTIEKIVLDEKQQVVHIDMSKNFVKDMNAGTSAESLILRSLTNTLGDYYNLNNVYITIDGNPYSSGHILMKVNEYLKVDYTNVIEYKAK